MGGFGFQFKNKGRLKCQLGPFVLTFRILLHVILQTQASPSSLDESNKTEPTTSTVRSWPSHEFLQDLISSSANATKTTNGVLRTVAEKKAKSIFGESFRGLPSNDTHDHHLQQQNASWVEFHQNRMFSSGGAENNTLLDKVPSSSFIENRIPLRVIDTRIKTDGFKTKLSAFNGSYNIGWAQDPLFDEAPHKIPNSIPVRLSFKKLGGISSIISTAPSIPLFTGATDQLETTLESPPLRIRFHDDSRRLPGRRISNRPMVHWGLGPVRFPSKPTPPKSTTSVPISSPGKPEKLPAAVHGTRRPITLQPFGELIPETSTVSGILPDLLFKIWSFSDDGLQLETQKVIPRELLHGTNITNGQVVNLDHIPLPIRKAVASAFNLNSSLIKRASGPGSPDAFHWQQLPSVLTPLVTSIVPTPPPPIRWNQNQNLPNQMALNYVLWPTTPMPPPPVPPPLPPASSNAVMEMFQQLLQSQLKSPHQMLQQAPNPLRPSEQVTIVPQSAHESKLKDADILANVASMALIMSKINKNLGQFQENVNSNEHVSPQVLLPLYMHYLKSGQSALGSEFGLKKSSPTPLLHRDTEQALHSDPDYSFYPSTNKYRVPGVGLAVSEYDDSYKNRFLFKTIKKKLKKLKKKKKGRRDKKKNSSSYSLFNPPGNFKFNYAFGVDILGMVQRMFYTVLALNAAPIVILAILTLTPLVLILIPKIMKWASIAKILWHFLHPPKPKRPTSYHHFYPPKIKHHHRRPPPPRHYHHHHRPPQYHHKGWVSHSWQPPKPVKGWSSHHRLDEDVHPTYPTWQDDAASNIGSLVQLTYGDPLKHRADEGDGYEFGGEDGGGEATTPFALYETDIDTEHNRKVMEILMNSKNSTLLKLLESWELNTPTATATFETGPESEPNRKEVEERRRKRRRKRSVLLRTLGRVVQIPKSTNIT